MTRRNEIPIHLSKRDDEREKASHPDQAKWAELLKRSFAIDILKCSKCSGKMKLISIIQDPMVAGGILQSMGISSELPKKSHPRAPPQQEFSTCQPDEFLQSAPDTELFE